MYICVQGDLLLANSANLGISRQPGIQYRLLATYAASLAGDNQHQRALVGRITSHKHGRWQLVLFLLQHYYRSALNVWSNPRVVHEPEVWVEIVWEVWTFCVDVLLLNFLTTVHVQVFPSGVVVKWNMYKSFLALKNYQDGFDIVGNTCSLSCALSYDPSSSFSFLPALKYSS